MRASIVLIASLLLATSLVGCRGMRSERPPIHPNLNMDFGPNFRPFRANPFFEDGKAMREPVPGTVARGFLRTSENRPFYEGRDAAGEYVGRMPVQITEALLTRGHERYVIYCSMCHGGTGDGEGIIMIGNAGQGFGYVPAPTFHSDFLREVPDGYLYDVIANGVRSMPAYGHQVMPADRWAIVAHIRALQRAQAAGPEDVPATELQRLRGATTPTPAQ